MKLRVTIGGESRSLDLSESPDDFDYRLQAGEKELSGRASIVETSPGHYSILLGTRSFAAHVDKGSPDAHIQISGRFFQIGVADARDRSGKAAARAALGPLEICAPMPGKVVKLLVEIGAEVEPGQGLIVVEAMKMQNEMKAPRGGKVLQVGVKEGDSVAASQKLMLLE